MATISDLPLEVLQLISEKMSVREWARVSSTCKEWWTTPLRTIDMSQSFGGNEWIAQRCQAALVLRCDLTRSNDNLRLKSIEELLPLLEVLMNGGVRNLDELHFLSLDPPHRSPLHHERVDCIQWLGPLNAAFGAADDDDTISSLTLLFEMLLQCHAHALRVLYGRVFELVPGRPFPLMPNLKHLILAFEGEQGLPEVAAALPQMLQLETLHLAYDPVHGYAKIPALDMRPCSKLQSVWLGGIAPAELALPSSCKVTLDLYSFDLACEPVWATLSSVHMLFIEERSGDFSDMLELDRIPLLQGAVKLDTVSLGSFKKCFEATEVMPPIAHARHLIVRGAGVDLHIPADNTWEMLTVMSWDYLLVDIDDIREFADDPPAFTFEFCKPMGIEFWHLLKALGNAWYMENTLACGKDGDDIMHMCNRCTLHKAHRCTLEGIGDEMDRFRGWVEDCSCCACVRCLTEAGKLKYAR